MSDLRDRLVAVTLDWERAFGNAPAITAAISEYDAAMLVGMPEEAYARSMQGATTVRKGFDFTFEGKRYQIKANRPSGKPGSAITWVPKAANYNWDYLVWVRYDPRFEIEEAWLWDVDAYKAAFDAVPRLSPADLRRGACLTREEQAGPPDRESTLPGAELDPKTVRADPDNGNYTIPRTYGVYRVASTGQGGTSRTYRYGNHPVRQKELERAFGAVELVALYRERALAAERVRREEAACSE